MEDYGRLRDVAVIVPAAGTGSRMGGTRKQFRLLGGKPLLVQTLLVFQHHPLVQHIIVAVPEGEKSRFTDALKNAGISKLVAVVPGGRTRQDSVAAALRMAPASTEIVLVHDAVRPFITRTQITRIIEVIGKHGAAALAVPVTDTVRYGEYETFTRIVSRENLFRMQTPQGCRKSWFEEAHRKALLENIQATDDVDLIQRAGYAVRIVQGSARNLKITTPADWELANLLWPSWHEDLERDISSGDEP